MYHFFVTPKQVQDGFCTITGQDVNHIRNVLRMRQGEQIGIRDGISRNYICIIEELGTDRIRARILSEEKENSELPCRIYLFQGLPKSDKMDWIIQKAVELGVYRIIPMATRRAVVKLEGKRAEAKVQRWNAIAASAAKQSGRMVLPEVAGVAGFAEACAMAGQLDCALIPYELAEGIGETRKILGGIRPGMEVAVMIGPEGGFDVEEVRNAQEAGILPITLGRRILRTETAGMAALSVLMFYLEQ
ncbi:MAG: 16S rRNA (uracil(1498)-N(3))-methyltransferase [Lachnospiraceae bacterium]|mgnify:CR=1 FL=1|nr:16S rRNA (uracil(1498)-N(3))-methyltransferase [Lachnospiraceae bacterium]